MENSWETRSEKMARIFDKTLEMGTWTGVLVSHILKGTMPSSLKKALARFHQHVDDRRYDRRIRVNRTINGYSNGKTFKNIHLVNISSGGMYVEVDSPGEVGPEAFFNLSGKNLGPIMRVKGHVVRRAERGMAVQFL